MPITVDAAARGDGPLHITHDGPNTQAEAEWASALNLVWRQLGAPPNADRLVFRMGVLLGAARPGWRDDYTAAELGTEEHHR